MAEEESARLWQVNRTIHELVKDRVSTRKYASNSIPIKLITLLFVHQGFQVSDEEIEMDLAQFRQLYANQMGNIEYAPFSFILSGRYRLGSFFFGLQPEPTQLLYCSQR